MTTPQSTWPMPTWYVGKRTLVYDSLPSTNDLAAELAAAQDAEGTAILAREQTAGRGQYGASWHSPSGVGIYLSAILNPPDDLRRPVVLTAVAAVAVCELIHTLTKRVATIKWPNDVLLDGKKACGLLIEKGCRTIIGVGLNVNHTADELARAQLPDATSLAMVAGQNLEMDNVARNLILTLDSEYHQLMAGRVAELEARWKQRLGLVGLPVVVETADGRSIPGHLRALSFTGMSLAVSGGHDLVVFPEQVKRMRRASD